MDSYLKMLRKSRDFSGGLGAVSFSVIEGLERAGAEEEELLRVRELMDKYFSKLSDEDCNDLCKVTYTRLNEDQHQKDDLWY